MAHKKSRPVKGDSVEIHVPNAYRAALIRTLVEMPEEAFGWFVAWASGVMMQYPDGLGGFRSDSRASITALRAEANLYGESQKK